jgi:transcription antitermination factor NusA-like protein
MKFIKHNAIDNFSCFTKAEKEDLIIQEMSKMFLLYPRATADILDNCGVTYTSLKPKDLSLAVEKNGKNLKMLNRIIRLSFLVNEKGNKTMVGHDRNIAYREVMKKGKPLIKEHQEAMKEATLLTRDMMSQEMFSKLLGKEVKVYLNLDGQGNAEESEAPKEIKQEIVEDKKTSPFVWVAIAVAVVGLGWWYYKSKNQSV